MSKKKEKLCGSPNKANKFEKKNSCYPRIRAVQKRKQIHVVKSVKHQFNDGEICEVFAVRFWEVDR